MSSLQPHSLEALDEEIRVLRDALAECHRKLAAMREETANMALRTEAAEVASDQAFQQLQIVRSSLAWKLSTPERLIREALRP